MAQYENIYDTGSREQHADVLKRKDAAREKDEQSCEDVRVDDVKDQHKASVERVGVKRG